jgi:hypothetical protein
MVLAHELAHVARWDALVNAVQILVQAVFWFHPLVWWMNQLVRHEREKCCDEMAVALLNADSRSSGSALVERVAAFYERACPSSSLAISGKAKDLEDRLRALTVPGRRFYRGPTMFALAAAFAMAGAVLPVGFALATAGETIQVRDDATFETLDFGIRSAVGTPDLEGLPVGDHVLAGTPFDIGGIVQLTNDSVTIDLPAARSWNRFHILHAIQGGAEEGAAVAHIRWSYADGNNISVPIVYGRHVRDWWFWNYESVADAGTAMAWTGSNDEVRRQGGSLRLYRSSFENPRPGEAVRGIAIEPAQASGPVPLLVAATLERARR